MPNQPWRYSILSDDRRDRLARVSGDYRLIEPVLEEIATMLAEVRAEGAAEVVEAVTGDLDDADQITDTLERPNYIAVWGVRRVLMRFGGKPHRWPVPSEKCEECGHRAYDHDEDCTWDDCDCLLGDSEAMWGRDTALDDEINQALWEDAVAEGRPWAMQDRPARTDPEADQ